MSQLNEILEEAKKEKTSNKSLPRPFTEQEILDLRTLFEILEPVAVFTDELQADGVTSSLVLIGFVHCVNGILSTK